MGLFWECAREHVGQGPLFSNAEPAKDQVQNVVMAGGTGDLIERP